jgi:hypothetical protein
MSHFADPVVLRGSDPALADWSAAHCSGSARGRLSKSSLEAADISKIECGTLMKLHLPDLGEKVREI